MARKPADLIEEPLPEADRVPGALHPRMAPAVLGQDAAISDFLATANSDRLHHALLLTGPRGVGKATLAWAIARWLLVPGEQDRLEVPPDDPVARRIRALSEPRLHLVRRSYDDKRKRLRAEITIDEIRRLLGFFQLSAADGGRRVAIIDAADEMNIPASNALLKLLEEPPENALLLLVAHRPARLLPTIRSRCRPLRLAPLAPDIMARILTDAAEDGDDMATISEADATALAALSGGSAGEAMRLMGQGGLVIYREIVRLFAGLPNMDRGHALRVAMQAGPQPRQEGDHFDLVLTLLDRFLVRLAQTGLAGPPTLPATPDEGAVLARLCPDPKAARAWADAQMQLSARAQAGRAVNLDPVTLILDLLVQLARVPVAPAA